MERPKINTVTMATTPVPDGGAYWQIVTGSRYCEITDGGRCVTDGEGDYGNNERCEVRALRRLFLTAEQYDVQACCDYLTVNGFVYNNIKGGPGPQAVIMNSGDTWLWQSDTAINAQGFKLCACMYVFARMNLLTCACCHGHPAMFTNA